MGAGVVTFVAVPSMIVLSFPGLPLPLAWVDIVIG
jgi:hypothetical protein